MLKKKGIKHSVLTPSTMKRKLNVAEAGRKGVVTIATNMAGRGTDIILAKSGLARREMKKLEYTLSIASATGFEKFRTTKN